MTCEKAGIYGERVYLIDFGIARRYRTGQSRDTRPLGSPGYAAPEQYGKEQSTTLTDIYGLGATLQTLLTGKEPWDLEKDGIPTDRTIPGIRGRGNRNYGFLASNAKKKQVCKGSSRHRGAASFC